MLTQNKIVVLFFLVASIIQSEQALNKRQTSPTPSIIVKPTMPPQMEKPKNVTTPALPSVFKRQAASPPPFSIPRLPTLPPFLKQEQNVTKAPSEEPVKSSTPNIQKRQASSTVPPQQINENMTTLAPPIAAVPALPAFPALPPFILQMLNLTNVTIPQIIAQSTVAPPVTPLNQRRQDENGEQYYGGFRQRPRWCRYDPCDYAYCPAYPRARCYPNYRLCEPVFVNRRGYVVDCSLE